MTGLKMDLVLIDVIAKGNDYLPVVMQPLTAYDTNCRAEQRL